MSNLRRKEGLLQTLSFGQGHVAGYERMLKQANKKDAVVIAEHLVRINTWQSEALADYKLRIERLETAVFINMQHSDIKKALRPLPENSDDRRSPS